MCMADQVAGSYRGLTSHTPLPTNLSSLGVIPAAPEISVIDNHKHMFVKLRSALRNRNPFVVGRERHIVVAANRTSIAEGRLEPTCSRVDDRGGHSGRKTIADDGQ